MITDTIYNFTLNQSTLVVDPALTSGLIKINNTVKNLVLYDNNKKFNVTIDLGPSTLTIPSLSFLFYNIIIDNRVITNKIKIEQPALSFNEVKFDITLQNVVNVISNTDGLIFVCQNGLIYQSTGLDSKINKLDSIYDITNIIGKLGNDDKHGVMDMAIANDQRWFIAVVVKDNDNLVLTLYEISTAGDTSTVLVLKYKNDINCKLLIITNYLFIAIGDLVDSKSQDLDNLFGKILRYDISTPTQAKPQITNPFIAQNTNDSTTKAKAEIYAYGIGNPTSLTVDDKGRIYCTDSGLTRQSIKLIGKGGNYGWPYWDGSVSMVGVDNKLSFIKPMFEYDNNTSIDNKLVSLATGQPIKDSYIFADICGRLYSIIEDNVFKINWTADISKLKYVKVIFKDNKDQLYLLCSDQLGPLGKTFIYTINNI